MQSQFIYDGLAVLNFKTYNSFAMTECNTHLRSTTVQMGTWEMSHFAECVDIEIMFTVICSWFKKNGNIYVYLYSGFNFYQS